MMIEIVYCDTDYRFHRKLSLGDGAQISDAIEASALLKRVPTIDLKKNKVGVFGQIKKLNTPLQDGDRVEVYRKIVCDPEEVPRRDRDDDDDDDDDE